MELPTEVRSLILSWNQKSTAEPCLASSSAQVRVDVGVGGYASVGIEFRINCRVAVAGLEATSFSFGVVDSIANAPSSAFASFLLAQI